MTRFPYGPAPGETLPRPVVPAAARFGERERRLWVLLDTGAPLTVVDRVVGDRLGVALGRKGAERTQIRLLGARCDVQFEHLDLTLGDETWSARVGILMGPALRMPFDGVLGSAGFFDRFVVTFAQYHDWIDVRHASNVPPV